MTKGKAWYWGRRAFKNDRRLLDAVRILDAELAARCETGLLRFPKHVYTFPRTDFGCVTWNTSHDRYKPLSWRYIASDRNWPVGDPLPEGHLIEASNLNVPAIDEASIPLHVIDQLDIASIDEIDDGFEIFGGLDHPTTVYFLEGALSGLIKIGIATHLKTRLSSIQTASQEPVSLICSVPGNKDLEKFLHGVFEPLRRHGEWFYPHWTIKSVIMGLEG